MEKPLHITSGDLAGASLEKAGLPGDVFVWHDVLYDGPRCPGWPDEESLTARSVFLEEVTAGGLDRALVLETLRRQYDTLSGITADKPTVLWFDACLFDQSMLAHLLACLRHLGARNVELLCVDAFPGIEPYHGLGQLRPGQLAALYGNRRPVTEAQFVFAVAVDRAFATQDVPMFSGMARMTEAPLPWIPAAVARWLQERPDPVTGLGRLEDLALAAIRAGCETPAPIFSAVSAADTPPQFWGDIMLWAKINSLADRHPPLVVIDGPAGRLPQWEGERPLDDFRITATPDGPSRTAADDKKRARAEPRDPGKPRGERLEG